MEMTIPAASLSAASGAPACWPDDLGALAAPSLDPMFWRPERLGAESAWWEHVPFGQWIAAAARPRVLVELGTHTGVSYTAFCQAVLQRGLEAACYAVDTWRGDPHAGEYGEDVFEDFRRFHDARYGGFSALLRMTFDEARDHFPNGSVDLLHIDGFHTYEAVAHDFESWAPKLSKRAVVLFHDTNVRQADFGVWRFWSELREGFPHFDFLHGHGLGVLAFGVEAPASVRALCTIREPLMLAAVRGRFSALGDLRRRETMMERLARTLAAAEPYRARALDAEAALRAAQAGAGAALASRLEAEARVSRAEADRGRTMAARVEAEAASSRLQQEVQTLRTLADDRLRSLLATRASTSWRLTAPMRSVARALRLARQPRTGGAGPDRQRLAPPEPGV